MFPNDKDLEQKNFIVIDPGTKKSASGKSARIVPSATESDGYTLQNVRRWSINNIQICNSRKFKFFSKKISKLQRREKVPDPIVEGSFVSVKAINDWFTAQVDFGEKQEVRVVGANGEVTTEMRTIIYNNGTKTIDFAEWMHVVIVKLIHKRSTNEYVKKRLHRQRDFDKYRLKMKVEDNILIDFEKKLGSRHDSVVCYGDVSARRLARLRHHPPFLKRPGWIRLLHKHGFTVYLIDEHGTTSWCWIDKDVNAKTERFKSVKNPRPSRTKYPTTLCWGLLRCSKCHRIFDRDVNATNNIMHLVATQLIGRPRPEYLNCGRRETVAPVVGAAVTVVIDTSSSSSSSEEEQ